MKNILIPSGVILGLVLNGCVSKNHLVRNDVYATSIANDFTKKISTYYQPLSTTINLKTQTKLDTKVATSLRQVGYGVVNNDDSQKLNITQVEVEHGRIGVIYHVSKDAQLARIYKSSGPISAWTAINMGSPKYPSLSVKVKENLNAAKKGKPYVPLHIRNKPSIESKILGTLKVGDIVTYKPIDDAWAKYKDGYIYYSYLLEVN